MSFYYSREEIKKSMLNLAVLTEKIIAGKVSEKVKESKEALIVEAIDKLPNPINIKDLVQVNQGSYWWIEYKGIQVGEKLNIKSIVEKLCNT